MSHGFSVQDAGGPAWTAPNGAKFFRLAPGVTMSVLVTKGVVTFPGHVDANRGEVRFRSRRPRPSAARRLAR